MFGITKKQKAAQPAKPVEQEQPKPVQDVPAPIMAEEVPDAKPEEQEEIQPGQAKVDNLTDEQLITATISNLIDRVARIEYHLRLDY